MTSHFEPRTSHFVLRKQTQGGTLILVLAAAAAAALPATSLSPPRVFEQFGAELTGAAERPTPVETNASGHATFMISEADSTIGYTITVQNISDVTHTHLHLAAPDRAGPPVVDLLPRTPQGKVEGTLVSGTITARDVMGEETFASLVRRIRNGEGYVNVHTKAHPNGEIRGQLRRE